VSHASVLSVRVLPFAEGSAARALSFAHSAPPCRRRTSATAVESTGADPALTDRANLCRTYGAPEAICTRISY